MIAGRARCFTALRSSDRRRLAANIVVPSENTFLLQKQSAPRVRCLATNDASAFSKSRAPFTNPKLSQEDTDGGKTVTWNSLGLWPHLSDFVRDELGFASPTPVQKLAIPAVLKQKDHVSFLAATGSGKTLAYALPLLQLCKLQDVSMDGERPSKRPRLIILAPTRELVVQITGIVKQICHGLKLSCAGGLYGSSKSYGRQRQDLDRPIDIVVATPGRLLKHWKDGNIYLSRVQHIVLDEMDTIVEQGFVGDLRELLYPIMYHKQAGQKGIDPATDLQEDAPRLVFTSATMTQAIQKILGDDELVGAKKHHQTNSAAKPSAPNQPLLLLPKMKVLKAKGLHQTVPHLQQVFVDVGGSNKINLLLDLLASQKSARTMVFCNTAASCRAVQFALSEVSVPSLAYHGELNSAARLENLKLFRSSDQSQVLVCTDLAARGLDIPTVDHVVLFDFPLNALDYLHRTGRTARQGQKGKVTALVAKRDKVLANAIERAVTSGQPIDGLSSRKSDYAQQTSPSTKPGRGPSRPGPSSRGGARRSSRPRTVATNKRTSSRSINK
ncbi:hypothetical protein FisN_7Lh160 [Fistulifera solaris]|uniref:RNA helicase n=1 Tax=Fistulifera solaris TaxID=1519565 RepID=A0A1Z5JDC7_FISSO|nr:hypothetical protein FisN_7Lh160 [Fistulifera solaris]|eukprot:GAX11778.1 hypothetical protein FisN_7Lh160 [Fistulifera solaris]